MSIETFTAFRARMGAPTGYTLARVENRHVHVAKVNSYDSFELGVEFGTWR